MKTLTGCVVVVLAAWLQVSFFGHVRPLGVMPNLMLVVVILFGLWANATPALAAAIGGGLLLDLTSGSDFGMRMAFYLVVALATIAGRQLGVRADSLITAVGLVLFGAILYNAIVVVSLGAPLSGVVAGRVARELVDDLTLTLLVYLVRVNVGQRARTALEFGRELPS